MTRTTSADTEERRRGNLTRNGRVVAYTPRSASTAVTRDAGLVGLEPRLIAANLAGDGATAANLVYGAGGSQMQQARAAYQPYRPAPSSSGMDLASLIKALGSGGGKSDALDWAKFNYQKQQDAAEAARAARSLAAMQQRYSSGAYGENIDKILEMIGQQGQMAETDIKNTFDRAVRNIQGGYDTALGLTGTGYRALQDYLAGAAYNPYKDVSVSAGVAPDAMENILAAYGTAAEPVRAQVAAEQQAAQAGAQGFQNLLNVLGGVAESGQLSRLAEVAMARNIAETGLGEQRAGYGTAAEQARANALAQLAQTIMSARIEEERRRGQLADELANAIIAAGGTGGGKDDGKDAETEKDGKGQDQPEAPILRFATPFINPAMGVTGEPERAARDRGAIDQDQMIELIRRRSGL